MQIKERTRQEIEARLTTMGDYVKIDYLQRVLNTSLDFDTRKFALVRLAALYEQRGLLLEAAKLMKSAAEINTTFKSKLQDYMKSVELYIRGCSFQEADYLFAQTLALGTERDKSELKDTYKKQYLALAQDLIKRDKRMHAKKAYEKLLTLDLSIQERKVAQETLLDLYNRLGNVQDYIRLKQTISGAKQ